MPCLVSLRLPQVQYKKGNNRIPAKARQFPFFSIAFCRVSCAAQLATANFPGQEAFSLLTHTLCSGIQREKVLRQEDIVNFSNMLFITQKPIFWLYLLKAQLIFFAIVMYTFLTNGRREDDREDFVDPEKYASFSCSTSKDVHRMLYTYNNILNLLYLVQIWKHESLEATLFSLSLIATSKTE